MKDESNAVEWIQVLFQVMKFSRGLEAAVAETRRVILGL